MTLSEPERIQVVDTHTGGEPTRVVVAGGPPLGSGSMAERVTAFRGRFDPLRSAIVNEPRGSDVMVGALVCKPVEPTAAAGVIFFNNVGYLGMCGHGTIGVAVALAHLGRIAPGVHRFETPVGTVAVTLEDPNHVAIDNVVSYRLARDVAVDVPGIGRVSGDVAWGGNWFFLVSKHEETIALANVDRLTDVTWRIRQALTAAGITGAAGAEIDHVELFGPPTVAGAHSKNFVLCPGRAYDRSPCGTGTSAKVACLVADGKLRTGEVWTQESIVGSLFEASAQIVDGHVHPRIRGSAYVNAESTLILDPLDPFALGIRA
jgi:4-hydroxyproline epimerase